MSILLKLLQALVQRHFGLTKREMADLLGKSVRQVERYLQQLRAAGIPLAADGESEDGVALRWRIDRSDFLGLPSEAPPLDFNAMELFLLVSAVESADLPASGWIKATRESLMQKIALYQKPRGMRQIPVLRERSAIQGPRAGKADGVSQAVMAAVLDGIMRSRRIEISYPWRKGSASAKGSDAKQDKAAKRIVDPLTVVLVRGESYSLVRVLPHKDFRLVKLSRIGRASVTEDAFNPPKSAELRKHLSQSFGLWQEAPRKVKIRVDAIAAPAIRGMTIHDSQRMISRKDGALDLYLTVGGREEIMWWILQWGEHAELLEPGDWRAALATTINTMQKSYCV